VGFTPEPTILKIVFDEDTPLHGLVIRARPCTIGEWNQLLSGADDEIKTGKERVENEDKLASVFLEHAVSWDLEIPPGTPVPLTLDGWHTLERSWGNLIITAWQFAMVGIPKTSENGSSSGVPLEEASLGLASISESLPNWEGPN
jgi:hypothetical protein